MKNESSFSLLNVPTSVAIYDLKINVYMPLKIALFLLCLFVSLSLNAQNKKKSEEQGSIQLKGFEYLEKNAYGYELYLHTGYKTKGNIIVELGTQMRFVLIPSGTFLMGTPLSSTSTVQEKQWNMMEKPHQVHLTQPFLMSETEVTQEVYERVMRESPWEESYIEDNPEFPAGNLPWEPILKFLERTQTELPTEAQWEYAARAGTTTHYYWGDEMNEERCWFQENSSPMGRLPKPRELTNKKPLPGKVKQKQPNAYGLYDMNGNVWELCQDWFDAYSGLQETDPKGPASGVGKVIRGGSFLSPAYDCRSASRRYKTFDTQWRDDSLGLRLVRNIRSE